MHLSVILLVGNVVAHAAQPASLLDVFSHAAQPASIPLNTPSIIKPSGLPAFEVNLDMPPADRWMHIAQHYRDHLIDHLDKLIPALNSQYFQASHQWLHEVPFDEEYEAELTGMAKAVMHPSVTTERLKWLNMLYEMDTPLFSPGCTGMLWTTRNGTVIQGRNMDDFNFDPLNPNRTLQGLAFDVTLHRGGKPFIKMTQLPGRVGVSHGMRYGHNSLGGYAIAQNSRKPNSWMTNLAAAKRGGKVFPLALRRIMEATEDFNQAVEWLSSGPFMAPHYFIVSGARANQGVVLTVDRLAKRIEQTPNPTHILLDELNKIPDAKVARKFNWFLVQTNDDIDKAPQFDFRRPFANHLLSTTTQDIVSEDHMMQFLHTTPLMNPGTVVSTVMVPRLHYYKTVLPHEPPEIIDGDAMDYKLFEQEFLQKWPITPFFDASFPIQTPVYQNPLDQPHDLKLKNLRVSLTQEGESKTARTRHMQHERRFLNRHRHHLTEKRHGAMASDLADEVSLVQRYWKLEI